MCTGYFTFFSHWHAVTKTTTISCIGDISLLRMPQDALAFSLQKVCVPDQVIWMSA